MSKVQESASNPNADSNQVVKVNVDGNDYDVKVGEALDGGESPCEILNPPENATTEFYASISKELKNLYKKNQETAQQLKQQKAELESTKSTSPDMLAEIKRLEGLIEGMSRVRQDDNRNNSDKRNSEIDPYADDALLKIAGVESWEDFEDLTNSQVARAQNKLQQMQMKRLTAQTQQTEQQYKEQLMLAKVESAGYTPAEFKSWVKATLPPNTPITDNIVGLFTQLKQLNSKKDTIDELDLHNQKTQIRNNIKTIDSSNSEPNFTFETPDQKARRKHIEKLKSVRQPNRTNISPEIRETLRKFGI